MTIDDSQGEEQLSLDDFTDTAGDRDGRADRPALADAVEANASDIERLRDIVETTVGQLSDLAETLDTGDAVTESDDVTPRGFE